MGKPPDSSIAAVLHVKGYSRTGMTGLTVPRSLVGLLPGWKAVTAELAHLASGVVLFQRLVAFAKRRWP